MQRAEIQFRQCHRTEGKSHVARRAIGRKKRASGCAEQLSHGRSEDSCSPPRGADAVLDGRGPTYKVVMEDRRHTVCENGDAAPASGLATVARPLRRQLLAPSGGGRGTPRPGADIPGPYLELAAHDAEAQAVLLEGWHQSYAQMSRGEFDGRLAQAFVDECSLFVEYTGRALYQCGALPDDQVAIGVPLALVGSAVFCGAPCAPTAVHAFSGRQGFEFYSPGGLEMAGIVVPRARLFAALSEHEADRMAADLEQAHLRTVPAERVAAARAFVAGAFEQLRLRPQLLEIPALRQSLANSALSNLVALLVDDEASASQRIAPSKRWQIVTAARDLVGARPETPTTVADLCSALGTSRRTLQYCFQDVLGVNPVGFLRALRLNGVHRSLKDATSVTEAATHWGFWHFGHFARDYRNLFGELPSTTYRRLHVHAWPDTGAS
jgi:AraC family transcriptional regulator, ethanolamine operon transcriptional activator